MTSYTIKNKSGQEIGKKGSETRKRLLDATFVLLDQKRLKEIRSAEISTIAQAAPSTFYLYFQSVEDAVLELIKELDQSNQHVTEPLHEEWNTDNCYNNAFRFISRFITYWDENYSALRVRNLAADEKEAAFAKARLASLNPTIQRIEEIITLSQKAGRVPTELHPRSMAAVIVASLERLATAYREESEYRPEKLLSKYRTLLIQSAAFMMISMMMGERTIPDRRSGAAETNPAP